MNANESLSFAQRAGNVMSNLLLGQTKEIIVRMNERLEGVERDVSDQKRLIKELTGSVAVLDRNVAVVRRDMKHYGVIGK